MTTDPIHTGHVYASFLRGLLSVAEAHGFEPRQLCAEAGINHTLVSLADAKFTVSEYYALFGVLKERVRNPDLGLLIGRISHMENIHFLLYMACTARNLREWLNMMPSFGKLAGDIGVVRVARDSKNFALQWHPYRAPDPVRCSGTDSVLATSVLQMGSFCVLPLEPVRVDLTYPKPKNIAVLESMLGKNIHFNQRVSALHYPLKVLDYKMAPVSTRFYAGVAEEFSRRFSDAGSVQDPFFLALYSAIRRKLPQGECSIEQVAKELHTSRRTLQRRLSERDTNFLQILQSIKYELAKHYLEDGSLSVIEIAFLLGYADPSTFSAAFKSWHGSTPTEYRKAA